jgi:hypothetical protein
MFIITLNKIYNIKLSNTFIFLLSYNIILKKHTTINCLSPRYNLRIKQTTKVNLDKLHLFCQLKQKGKERVKLQK